MRIYDNIEKYGSEYKEDIHRMINDLIDIRDNEEATSNYFDTFINTLPKYERWRIDKLNNEDTNSFSLPCGAISPDKVSSFIRSLLICIRDEASFGYLFYECQSFINRETEFSVDCMPDKLKIQYALKFDIDDTIKKLEQIENQKDKCLFLLDKECESDMNEYKGELKDKYELFCKHEIERIKERESLKGGNHKNRPSEEDLPWILGNKEQKEKTLNTLKFLIGDNKAAHACKVLVAAIQCGAITKPKYSQIIVHFQNIGEKQGYYFQLSKYGNETYQIEIAPFLKYFNTVK